jgi:hypothetical protein
VAVEDQILLLLIGWAKADRSSHNSTLLYSVDRVISDVPLAHMTAGARGGAKHAHTYILVMMLLGRRREWWCCYESNVSINGGCQYIYGHGHRTLINQTTRAHTVPSLVAGYNLGVHWNTAESLHWFCTGPRGQIPFHYRGREDI